MVLGTPSYMSPEQLAGKKIDGRSTFSRLALPCIQLCCGKLPFTGESMAQLMFKIANEPRHPDILGVVRDGRRRRWPRSSTGRWPRIGSQRYQDNGTNGAAICAVACQAGRLPPSGMDINL